MPRVSSRILKSGEAMTSGSSRLKREEEIVVGFFCSSREFQLSSLALKNLTSPPRCILGGNLAGICERARGSLEGRDNYDDDAAELVIRHEVWKITKGLEGR